MRLTKLEKEMLARCAEFVLAGEWPWDEDEDGNKLSDAAMRKEAKALARATDKLAGIKPDVPSGVERQGGGR